jgi:hypothetical protein
VECEDSAEKQKKAGHVGEKAIFFDEEASTFARPSQSPDGRRRPFVALKPVQARSQVFFDKYGCIY